MIVDNADSESGGAKLATTLASTQVRLQVSGGNVGFGAACNAGMRAVAATGATYGLLLNPDATLTIESLRLLVRAAEAAPRSLITPVISGPRDITWFSGGALDLRKGRATHQAGGVDWLTAACLLPHAAMD